MDDALAIAGLINNWRVASNLARVPYPYMLDDAHNWLAFLAAARNAHVFAVILGGAPAGVVGLETTSPEPEAELGYWLGEPWWGKGYMSEAANAAVSHAFAVLGFERLTAGYRHGNEGSRRLLDGLGFRHTGHALRYSAARRVQVEIATVEITRREWLTGGAR